MTPFMKLLESINEDIGVARYNPERVQAHVSDLLLVQEQVHAEALSHVVANRARMLEVVSQGIVMRAWVRRRGRCTPTGDHMDGSVEGGDKGPERVWCGGHCHG